MMVSWRQSLIMGLFLGSLLSFSSEVLAAGPDAKARAEAQKLYEDGAKDLEVDDYARACPKFEAAFKILPEHIRTGLTLAECLDKLGQPAAALKVLESVSVLAQAKGDTKKMQEIEAIMVDVDSRVPRLILQIPNDIATMPGFSISRDGIPVPRAIWATPIPLESGNHEVEASAVDRETWKKEVVLRVGDRTTVVVEPPWEKLKPKVIVLPGSKWPNRLKVFGILGISAGAAGLVTWGVLGGVALSKNNASLGHCDAKNTCDSEGFNRRNEAISLGHGATGALVAGTVLTAAGVTLLLVSRSAKKTPATNGVEAPEAAFWVGPTGFGVRGSW